MKVFLSSTYRDLVDYRKIAINYLEGIMGHIADATGHVVAMEFFNASEYSSKEECLRMLEPCNLVVGIYGDCYGSVDDETGLSLTETEFDFAQKHNIPVLRFVKKGNNRDMEQERFIREKVYSKDALCANFESESEFANRLDGSLKKYFGSLDGYSISSLWAQVSLLREVIEEKIANEVPGYELQMLPYTPGQEDIAIENIIYGAKCINMIHDKLMDDYIKSDTGLIPGMQECIYLGLKNWPTSILLAATYLKLRRMQNRLLSERWSEALRQEVIKVRKEYVDTIYESRYVD